MNEQTNKQLNEQARGQLNEQTDGLTDIHLMEKRIEKWKDR
jgi:hypothetical protein